MAPTTTTTTIFQDHAPSDTISIPSTWRKVRQKAEGTAQTEPYEVAERGVQVVGRVDVNTQTLPPPPLPTTPTYDPTTLTTFLTTTERPVSTLLLQNLCSTAFDHWTPQWETPLTETTLSHTFDSPPHEGTPVTQLAWNVTGTTLAVAYGRLDHESWCVHRGGVETFAVGRNRGEGRTGWGVEVESCVTTLAYHPTNPSHLLLGTFTGRILLTTTSDTASPILHTTTPTDATHQEPIAKLVWMPSSSSTTSNSPTHQIMSIGNDGKIITWSPTLQPLRIAQLRLGSIPRSLRGNRPDTVLGGTDLALPLENPTIYLVGTESGFVAKCSQTVAVSIESDGDKIGSTTTAKSFPSPIQFAYQPHTGPVTALASCPFHRNLFATAGSEGEVRVYNILQSKPLLTLTPTQHTLLTLSFSPLRATVFAATSTQGLLYIYDLARSPSLPHTTLQVSPNADTAATALAFGNEFVATGDAGGVVRVWRVASALKEECVGRERALVEGLGGLIEEVV